MTMSESSPTTERKRKRQRSEFEKMLFSKLNTGQVRRLLVKSHRLKKDIVDLCFLHTVFYGDLILFDFKKGFWHKNCRKFRYVYKLCRNRGLQIGIHMKNGERLSKKFLKHNFDFIIVDEGESDKRIEWLQSFINRKDCVFKEKYVKSTTLVL